MLAGHWVPDAVRAAGRRPLGPAPGEASPYATWDELRALAAGRARGRAVRLRPAAHARGSRAAAGAAPGLAPRVLLMDGNAYLNRPGPRLVDAVETLAGWLASEAPPAADAVAWEATALR